MWTETFDDSGAAESAVAASDFDFAAGTALRVTETEEFVVVDLTACRADDLEHGLPGWWASNVSQYHLQCVIQIKVQAGAEQIVQKTLEMVMSKPTVEYDEGRQASQILM